MAHRGTNSSSFGVAKRFTNSCPFGVAHSCPHGHTNSVADRSTNNIPNCIALVRTKRVTHSVADCYPYGGPHGVTNRNSLCGTNFIAYSGT